MILNKFSRKAWISTAIIAASASVVLSSFATADPPPCDQGEAELTLANDLLDQYVCVKPLGGGTYINRELHSSSDGKIREAGVDVLGTFAQVGQTNVVEYVYDNNGGTFRARYCRNGSSTKVHVVGSGTGSATYAAEIQGTVCPP